MNSDHVCRSCGTLLSATLRGVDNKVPQLLKTCLSFDSLPPCCSFIYTSVAQATMDLTAKQVTIY